MSGLEDEKKNTERMTDNRMVKTREKQSPNGRRSTEERGGVTISK
jgi:hypothetical protein